MSFEDEIEKKLNSLLKEMTSKSNLKKIGLFAASLIKKRTRLGYGVRLMNGSKEKLKKLSDSYKKQRKNMDLSGKTTENRSNLTQTGRMLDDLTAWINANGSATIGIEDAESYLKMGWAHETGREFNLLSEAEIKQIRQYIENMLKGND